MKVRRLHDNFGFVALKSHYGGLDSHVRNPDRLHQHSANNVTAPYVSNNHL